MRQHYGLNRLMEYGISALPETTRLVNPAWRALESQARRTAAELNQTEVTYPATHLRVVYCPIRSSAFPRG